MDVHGKLMQENGEGQRSRDSGCSLSDLDTEVDSSTPHHHDAKRRVSFADERGADLDSFVEFPDNIEYDYLSDLYTKEPAVEFRICPGFDQPGCDFHDIMQRVEKNNVTLENVAVEGCRLLGTVRVKNLAYNKSLFARCTFDGWKSHQDFNGAFVTSCGPHDLFSFEVPLDPEVLSLDHENRMDFSICYECQMSLYWDNNQGENYTVRVLPVVVKPDKADTDSAFEGENEANDVANGHWSKLKDDEAERKKYQAHGHHEVQKK